MTDLEQQIRQLVDLRVMAMKDGDAQTLVAHYTHDVVNFDLAPPLQHSGPEGA